VTTSARETWTAVLLILAIAALASLLQPMDSEGAELRYYLSGPVSLTAHSPSGSYEDIHPGLGLEVQASPDAASPWSYGIAGHYMAEDSHSLPCWWVGATGGYTLGDRQGWWLEPGIVLGGIKKPGLYNDDFGPLVLPRLSGGYDMVSLDLSYIPAMRCTGNTRVGYAGFRWRFWGAK
jgi:hypothetical protein